MDIGKTTMIMKSPPVGIDVVNGGTDEPELFRSRNVYVSVDFGIPVQRTVERFE
jgi:hypothetical protein